MSSLRRYVSSLSSYEAVAFDCLPGTLSVSQKPRVVFGQRAAEKLAAIAESAGMERPLLVRHADAGHDQQAKYIEFLLQRANIPCFSYSMQYDFSCIDDVNRGVAMAKRLGADSVIACGGGNVMDTSRAIAAMVSNAGNAEDYVSVRVKNIIAKINQK